MFAASRTRLVVSECVDFQVVCEAGVYFGLKMSELDYARLFHGVDVAPSWSLRDAVVCSEGKNSRLQIDVEDVGAGVR